jgi:hypothetical protein
MQTDRHTDITSSIHVHFGHLVQIKHKKVNVKTVLMPMEGRVPGGKTLALYAGKWTDSWSGPW